MPARRSIAPIFTWLAAIFIALVVIIVPTGHFFVSYQYIKGSVVTEARINAATVNQVIGANPEMWELEQERLEDALSQRAEKEETTTRRVYNNSNELVAESVASLAPPVITASQEVFDAGLVVGRIEISRSLRPLVAETALLVLLMLPLGVGTFLTLRLLPIRSLYRAERSLWKTNEFLKKVMESTTNAIAVTDPKGAIVLANRRASDITGYDINELNGLPYSGLIAPGFLKALTREAEKVIAEGRDIRNVETMLVRKDGTFRNIACGMSPLMQEGNVSGVVISVEDITERKEAGRALREAKERYERIVEDMPDFICRYKPDMTITFVNEAYAQHIGRPAQDLPGTSFLDLVPLQDHGHLRAAVSSLTPLSSVASREFDVFAPDGELRWHLWRDRGFFDEEGRLVEIQSIGQDITERKQVEERLHTLSLTDELTGLYNRRGFYTLAEQQLRIARRHRSGVLLLAADLDNLKVINDTWGHQEGDTALVDAANIIRTCFRESDVVARIGGDEFVVFQLTGVDVAPDVVTSRLQRKFDRYNAERNGGYRLSVSIGITQFTPGARCAIEEMLDQVDKLMYERKKEKQSHQQQRLIT